MKNLNKQAFTLVELIVVITILAILGTIAFISLQGYSRDSRDGARIADLNSIQKSLEIYITEKGIYPIPDEEANISYSGGLAWIEGTVGDGVIRNLDKINKKPLDPLTGNEYTYSITSGKTEYQLGAIKEGGLIGYELPLNQTYAATEKKAIAMIRGTYNERFLKVKSGSLNWLVAMPTIITADIRELDLQGQLNNKLLVYGNYGNLPHSYNNLGFAMNGGFDYTNNNPLVYSGSMDSILEDDNKLIFIDNLKEAYNGTIIQGEPNYQDIVNTNTGTNQTGAIYLVNNLINTDVGGINPGNVVLTTNINSTQPPIENQPVTSECALNSTEVSTLNGLLSTSSIEIYSAGRDMQYPSTINDWCTSEVLIWYGGENIPNEIWKLTNLESLWLENNSLTSLPSSVGNLTNLTTLKLQSNSISSFPSEIWNLTNLTTLDFSSNLFTTIPNGIGNLTNLTTLSAGYNSISSISTELFNLTNITSLFIPNNPINTLPTEIGNLTNLKQLYLNFTGLSSLPTTIGNLINLETLNIGRNSLTTLPTTISNLTNLKQLFLDHNTISTLPLQIFTLINLEILWLGNNSFTTIPIEIGNLTNLKNLIFNWNTQLTSLPSSIGNLVNLTTLDLYNTSVSNLPTEIGNLTNLTTLKVSQSPLTSLPSSIGNLTKLTNLVFSHCSLTSLPSSIGNLVNLTTLDLTYNSLSTLPTELTNLIKLSTLSLYSNTSLGTLSFYFIQNTSNRSQLNIPTAGKTMTIGGNGTKIVITITP